MSTLGVMLLYFCQRYTIFSLLKMVALFSSEPSPDILFKVLI